MAVELAQTFAGNPLIPAKRAKLSSEELAGLFREAAEKGSSGPKILPILDSRPLIATRKGSDGLISWQLAWQTLSAVGLQVPFSDISTENVSSEETEGMSEKLSEYDSLVYLGEKDDVMFFAMDVPVPETFTSSAEPGARRGGGVDPQALQTAALRFKSSEEGWENGFVDLRTFMIAADWSDKACTEQLAIVGNARALLEWHKQARFCGRCGSHTRPVEAGNRRQCTDKKCNTKAYPRTDPAVIMAVIDRERDCVVLGRQSRFRPKMWSCLAGFTEPGESLEEAVRRETREEVGLQVGPVLYHTSQPWPVGSSSMSYQIMIGFFAWAESVDIRVDERELAEAKWFTREEVREMLTFVEYRENQRAALEKVHKMCHPDEDVSEKDSSGPTPSEIPYVPGPYAIAHHLLRTWVEVGSSGLCGLKPESKGLDSLEQLKSSM